MTAVAVQGENQVARPLRMLVSLIREDLKQGDDAAQSAAMPYYEAAGEKMLEAKGQLVHGEFTGWLKRSFNRGVDQCNYYMKLAIVKRGDATIGIQKPTAADYSSIKDFRRRGLGHDIPTTGGGLRQPSWQESVKENIDRARREAERLRQEDLTRQQERDAEKQLALRLIDIGFKILVKELHPDKGGSRDAMSRLNRVRDRLKQHA